MLSLTEAKNTGRIDFMAPKWHDSTEILECLVRNMSCWMVKVALVIPGIVGRWEGRRGFEERAKECWNRKKTRCGFNRFPSLIYLQSTSCIFFPIPAPPYKKGLSIKR